MTQIQDVSTHDSRGHRWFAAIYDTMNRAEERGSMGRRRRDLLHDLAGDVLEIGAGTGANFEHYPESAHVIALEPDPFMLKRGREKLAKLDRPGRLLAVVLLLVTGMSWYSSRLWVHEKYFDYLVAQQKTSLDLGCIELAGDIANFLRERAAASPQRPQPATWDRDVDALLRYEQETSLLFEAEFGLQVRRTREMMALRGFVDRDLDAFYRRPANAFQITVVARRLAALAHRLENS